jgi:hypothetical protein
MKASLQRLLAGPPVSDLTATDGKEFFTQRAGARGAIDSPVAPVCRYQRKNKPPPAIWMLRQRGRCRKRPGRRAGRGRNQDGGLAADVRAWGAGLRYHLPFPGWLVDFLRTLPTVRPPGPNRGGGLNQIYILPRFI